MVLSACGDDAATAISDEARAELRAAIEKTLAVDSLHIEVSQKGDADDEASSGRISIDFNAPDRIRSVSADGHEANDSIVIGDTVYFSDLARPGLYFSSKQPGGQSPPGNLFSPLKAIRDADSVRVIGDDYVARLGGETSATATLRIEGGYVVRLRLKTGTGNEALDVLYEFSKFGSADEVAAPPAEKVAEAPITPECPEDGPLPDGVFVCTGGDQKEPREVALPAPTEPAESTLQFRPVRNGPGSGCTPRDTNPPAVDAAAVLDADGACLDLAEAGFEVDRVQELRATTTEDGQEVVLDITLLSGDARRFDQIAEDNLGRRLALVVFGRVVSAPTIYTTEFDGRLQLSGLSLEEAARVRAALTT